MIENVLGKHPDLDEVQISYQAIIASQFGAEDLLDSEAKTFFRNVLRQFVQGTFRPHFEAILLHLERADIPQKTIAATLGVSTGTVSRWYKGTLGISSELFYFLLLRFQPPLASLQRPTKTSLILAGLVRALAYIRASIPPAHVPSAEVPAKAKLALAEFLRLRKVMCSGVIEFTRSGSDSTFEWRIAPEFSAGRINAREPNRTSIDPAFSITSKDELLLKTWGESYLLLDYVMAPLLNGLVEHNDAK